MEDDNSVYWIHDPYHEHYHKRVKIVQEFANEYLVRLPDGTEIRVKKEDVTDDMF